MTTLFIADLHLHDQRPELTRAFLQFLTEKAGDAESLYILGDLFEAWVGDDDDSETAFTVRQALRKLTDSGVKVFLQHGNRDFLIGDRFAKETGATLLPDLELVNLYGQSVLAAHGDQFCTDDVEYQKFKQQVRSDQWQQDFLSKSLTDRKAIVQHIRTVSNSSQTQKSMAIMDVNSAEVDRVMDQQQVNYLIHGHTHRPHIHPLDSNKQRIVLGDWESHLWYLRWDSDHNFQLVSELID
ncbi:MAG: UDP-2,3-diacylglucosamine diphosphatase [Motiliproteus sp.]|nr:UDP-2,3-diacylglucosamine diphosphatase [Motiliproteus sp.]MCW9053223.1 UDP-2,3-diacylglucosamine diphosphatase [Motiliproteus sp.]